MGALKKKTIVGFASLLLLCYSLSMQKENINEKGDLATIYEVSYLLLPSLALEQVPARVETLTKMVESAGGELISSENPILVDLAYGMTKVVQTTRHKCSQGYFGWMKFTIKLTIR